MLKRLAATTLLLAAGGAHADDGDMRVLSDEITERGDIGLDLQLGASRRPRDAALEQQAAGSLIRPRARYTGPPPVPGR